MYESDFDIIVEAENSLGIDYMCGSDFDNIVEAEFDCFDVDASPRSNAEILMKQKRKMDFDVSFVESSGNISAPVPSNMEVLNANDAGNSSSNPQIILLPASNTSNNVTLFLVPHGMVMPQIQTPVTSNDTSNQPSLPKAAKLITMAAQTSNPQIVRISNNVKNGTGNNAPQGEEQPNMRMPVADIANILNSNNNSLLLQKRVALVPSKTIISDDVLNVKNSSMLLSENVSQSVKAASNALILNQFSFPETQATQTVVSPVSTIVFFDLETTGLGHQIGVSNVQITEITMIAMDRNEFQDCPYDDLKTVRVINKLSLCTRPRYPVSYGASKITGLNEINLCNQKQFDKDFAQMITIFLSRLPKPVCLLAHNGNSYDYPLIKAEFSRLGMQLPPDVLTADTLVAFRSIGLPAQAATAKRGRGGRQSFSLENIHLHFFRKKPAGGHSAEGDVMALAKVCHKIKDQFLPWVDRNTRDFDSVTSMW